MALPFEVFRARVKNEIASCSRYLRHSIELDEFSPSSFPLEVRVELKGVSALELSENGSVTRDRHRFSIILSREYPFEKPLVIWRTPIFHPNIMMPEDGGHVCIKLLDEWSFNSTLLSFIKGIETLLLNPNPESPFGTKSCTMAAEYFNANRKRGPPAIWKPLPRIIGRD